MSGDLPEQPRIVRCPKCRVFLPEYSHYTVYKCGGCGATLQAKKRKKEPAHTESLTCDTDAAPRNAVNLVCNGEQTVLTQEEVLRTKTSSSSSEECSSDGADRSSLAENGECIDRKLVIPKENVARTIGTSSSSGDCCLDGNGRSSQNENGESNENQLVLPQENVVGTNGTSSSSGECFLDGNGGSSQNENGESNENQLVLPQEDVVMTKRTSSSSGDCFLNVNGKRDQNENGECDGKQLAPPQQNVLRTTSTSSSGEYPSDVNKTGECNREQLDHPQEEVSRTKSTSSSEECSLDENGSRVQIRNEETYEKKLVLPQGIKAASFSSGECSLDENGSKEQDNNGQCNRGRLDLPLENIQRTKSTSFSSGECSLDEAGGRDQHENGDFNIAFSLSDEDLENEIDTDNLSHGGFRKHKASSKGCSTKLTETRIEASSSSSMGGASSVEETTDTHLQLAGAKRSGNRNLSFKEEKEQLIGASDGVDADDDKSAQIEVKSEVKITGSEDTATSLTNDSFAPGKGSTSGNPISSPNKQMKQAQEPKPHTFDTSQVMNQSSELSGDLGELSKSPTTRSYHTYDGSVSSYDEMDKRLPNEHLNSFEKNYNATNVFTEGRHRKGKGPISSMNVPPGLPRGRYHIMRDTKRSQYEALETTRHDRPFRHRMRAGTEDFPPRMPYHQSGSQSGYESDIPLNQMPDDEHYFSSSSFLSPDHCEDSDQEKMKLLRVIYKLQNQLKRTSSLKGDATGRIFPSVSYKGNHVSASQSYDFHEGRRFSHDLNDPWSDARYSHGLINWRQRSKISQIPFSAEATTSTHRVDNSCFHCHHQEWRYSAELPPHAFYQHEEFCRYHTSLNNCCFPQRSHPFSAPRYLSSKLQLYGHETKSTDQRHRAHEMRVYLRDKQNMNKKHFRPVAGGAPLITCRNCFKLLQLPADFLLFKRVCHQLKCGHCSEILKFSFQGRSHIVSYDSSQLDDQSEVINGSINTASSASQANYFPSSHAVPVSFSDDYGNFVSKSYSSGGDPVSLTALHPLHGSEHDTNNSSGAFEEEETASPRHARSSKATVGTHESTGVSFNMSWSEKSSSEREQQQPPSRSSPLHQLMGYSSPSQVIRGIHSFSQDNE